MSKKSKVCNYYQYAIVKYRHEYHIIDMLSHSFDNNKKIHISKDNRLYFISSIEIVDDYYCDIGAITHYETEKNYIGRIVFQSDDIEEIALIFFDLRSE